MKIRIEEIGILHSSSTSEMTVHISKALKYFSGDFKTVTFEDEASLNLIRYMFLTKTLRILSIITPAQATGHEMFLDITIYHR